MIYTVTLNPSLDYITRLTHLKLGETNRSDSQIMYPEVKVLMLADYWHI